MKFPPFKASFTCLLCLSCFAFLFIQCKSTADQHTDQVVTPGIDTTQVLQMSEIAPRFPGCEDLSSLQEKKKCADKKLLQYVYDHIQYPVYAKDHGVQGRCVISFVVESNGSLTDARIVKDIGGGCGEASLAVVQGMNTMPERWIPGMDKGKVARVLYYLPINFRLEDKIEK